MVAIMWTQADPAWTGQQRRCSGRAPTIVGTDQNDDIRGTPGNDVIAAGEGDDIIRGLDGDDFVCGGYGTDTLLGGIGNDYLAGGPGEPMRTCCPSEKPQPASPSIPKADRPWERGRITYVGLKGYSARTTRTRLLRPRFVFPRWRQR